MLLTLTLVYTLNFIDRALLGVLAQPVITTFGLTDTQFGFLAGPPFALFYALMGIPIAMAADRYNRIAIIALCIALWSLMTALCGLADGFLFLLIARVGVAIGEAGSNPPSNSVIADYYRPAERPKALSIYSTGVMFGSALAFLIGGQLGQMPDDQVVTVLEFFGLGGMPQASTGARATAGGSRSSPWACRACCSPSSYCSPCANRRVAGRTRPDWRRSHAAVSASLSSCCATSRASGT